MDTERLRAFLVVADELSFTRAASRCFISQPALSRQIRDLEREVGRELFVRTTHQVVLTHAGVALQRWARQLIDTADSALADIRSPAPDPLGSAHALRVGLFHPGAAELTGPILARFHSVRPDVALRLIDITSTGTEDALVRGRVDVALVWGPTDPELVTTRPLFLDATVAVMAEQHELAQASCLSSADLFDHEVTRIELARPAWCDYWAPRIAPARRGRPRIVPVPTFEDSLLAAAAGSAISWAPACMSRYSRVAGLSFVPVQGLAPVEVEIAARKADNRPLVRAFLSLAEQTADALQDLVVGRERPALTLAAQ